eukprot:TRINITY_DN8750_c0_g1_i2.p1 TRINITY_DN8750_c0_g1~~TRINITY_DN8750_c0_g1_i2.p1  ORF type:complete len:223 (+),score=62.72 TRINITY_DN8750_c0_g1_i2:25-669(+)
MIRRPPRSTHCISSAASDVYKRQVYTSCVKRELTIFIQERCKALEELARSMVEISLPMPWRFLFWAMDNNVDILNVQKKFPALKSIIENGIKKEDTKIFREALLAKMRQEQHKKAFTDSVRKIKKLIKQIVQLQKEVQIELTKITKQIVESFLVNVTPSSGQTMAQLVLLIRNMPEVSDKMVYQLEDSDFSGSSMEISVCSSKFGEDVEYNYVP